MEDEKVEIVSFGRETRRDDWRLTAILGFCNTRLSCKVCPLQKTFCCRRHKTLTELDTEEQREALRIIVREDI